MSAEQNLKYVFGAETGELEKGVSKVKRNMKDLDKVSTDLFSSLGAAIGVDTSKLQQFSSAIQGLGNKFKQTGAEGASAFGKVSSAIASVGAGIAALGIAAAVAAFKDLNAEADAFENTIQGGAVKLQGEAFRNTAMQYLRDQNESAAKGMSNFRQTIKDVGATLKMAFVSGFDMDKMAEAAKRGDRAAQIAKRLYEIELQRKENSVEVSRLDAEIAKRREIISDTTKTSAERAQALAEAQELIRKKAALQLPLARERRDLIVEMNGLASTTLKDYDSEIAAKIEVNNLEEEQANGLRAIERQQGQINTQVEKEKKERAEIADLMRRWNDFRLDKLERVGGGGYAAFSNIDLLNQNSNFSVMADAVVTTPIKLAPPSRQNVEEVKRHIIDISEEIEGIINNLTVSIGESLGTLIGDLINGEDPWGNFANNALSAFADMAIAIGKIAIAAGLATEEIKKALLLDGGWGAVAAGVALVALGSAVKAGLSNVANGNYSASSGVATSTSSNYASGYEQRDVYVNVQGVLRADGDQLVAVINNTNKKTQFTT